MNLNSIGIALCPRSRCGQFPSYAGDHRKASRDHAVTPSRPWRAARRRRRTRREPGHGWQYFSDVAAQSGRDQPRWRLLLQPRQGLELVYSRGSRCRLSIHQPCARRFPLPPTNSSLAAGAKRARARRRRCRRRQHVAEDRTRQRRGRRRCRAGRGGGARASGAGHRRRARPAADGHGARGRWSVSTNLARPKRWMSASRCGRAAPMPWRWRATLEFYGGAADKGERRDDSLPERLHRAHRREPHGVTGHGALELPDADHRPQRRRGAGDGQCLR